MTNLSSESKTKRYQNSFYKEKNICFLNSWCNGQNLKINLFWLLSTNFPFFHYSEVYFPVWKSALFLYIVFNLKCYISHYYCFVLYCIFQEEKNYPLMFNLNFNYPSIRIKARFLYDYQHQREMLYNALHYALKCTFNVNFIEIFFFNKGEHITHANKT